MHCRTKSVQRDERWDDFGKMKGTDGARSWFQGFLEGSLIAISSIHKVGRAIFLKMLPHSPSSQWHKTHPY